MDDSPTDVTLDALLRAIARRDLPTTLEAPASTDEPYVVGSEVGEAARGRAAIEEFFTRIYASPGAFEFDFTQRCWSPDGDIAWLVADGSVVEPGEAAPKPYGLTAVFVRENTDWKHALWSGSEPLSRS
jgi:ketosteroid isomerase-like protein